MLCNRLAWATGDTVASRQLVEEGHDVADGHREFAKRWALPRGELLRDQIAETIALAAAINA